MPRFRFHIYDDFQTQDVEGRQFSSAQTAHADAIQGARGIMADELQTTGHINLSHRIEIEDEDGIRTVVMFGDAVTVRHAAA
jgi:hypothetical protein